MVARSTNCDDRVVADIRHLDLQFTAGDLPGQVAGVDALNPLRRVGQDMQRNAQADRADQALLDFLDDALDDVDGWSA